MTSIGVSNIRVEDIELLIEETGETPVVNQIELHPYLQQQKLVEYHAAKGIATLDRDQRIGPDPSVLN